MNHESIDIVEKMEFEIRPDLGCTHRNVDKSVFGQFFRVCVSVLLYLFFCEL